MGGGDVKEADVRDEFSGEQDHNRCGKEQHDTTFL